MKDSTPAALAALEGGFSAPLVCVCVCARVPFIQPQGPVVIHSSCARTCTPIYSALPQFDHLKGCGLGKTVDSGEGKRMRKAGDMPAHLALLPCSLVRS